MITVGIAAATTAAVAAWVATPFVVMNRRGTLLEQQRAAMATTPAVGAQLSVIPIARRSTESIERAAV